MPDALFVPLELKALEGTSEVQARVWQHVGGAYDMGDAAADWFTKVVGTPCRLVRMARGFQRHMSQRAPFLRVDTSAEVSLADFSPFLLANEASLADLNKRMDTAIRMDRFRPNIVVSGAAPWEEDSWREIAVGDSDVCLSVVSHCTRCKMTTVDQQRGAFVTSGEPLRTLSSFRKSKLYDGEVLFGVNMQQLHRSGGVVRVGDTIKVLKAGTDSLEFEQPGAAAAPSVKAKPVAPTAGTAQLPELAQCRSDTTRFCGVLGAASAVLLVALVLMYVYGSSLTLAVHPPQPSL